jgi:hypothetical protein
MVEMKYRKNPTPIMTSANDILSAKDPAALFQDMIDNADNGTSKWEQDPARFDCYFDPIVISLSTVFIDEAYHFNPAPKGSTSNASNHVLDLLMKVAEDKRVMPWSQNVTIYNFFSNTITHFTFYLIIQDTISFILAGYKEEILNLLTYNPGFPSRFNTTFEFPDYTETQLQDIMCNIAKDKGFSFQKKKHCGVPIAKILARRLAKGAGKKGLCSIVCLVYFHVNSHDFVNRLWKRPLRSI